MEKAIDAVRAGMSFCKAQKEFGVLEQTPSDRINGRWKSTKPGGTMALFEHKCFNSVKGPSHTWWAKFKTRHEKETTLRKPDKLDRGRSHGTILQSSKED